MNEEVILKEREELTGSPSRMDLPELTEYDSFELQNSDDTEVGELIALYDFETNNEKEIGFNVGDKLKLLKRDIISGWHLAKLNESRGIVPCNYVQELSKGLQTDHRNSVFDYQPIKKFSWFINNGVDDYLLGKPIAVPIEAKDLILDVEKHFIEFGPHWQQKTNIFSIFVHSPKTQLDPDSLKEFTTFLLTSSFEDDIEVTVERRFSQFEWLHERLAIQFRALVLPPLPEKQFTGRFSEEFIERRRRQLERYLNRLLRHPVVRYSDLFVHFLNCTTEEEWIKEEKKINMETKNQALTFFQNVYHPEFNVDEDGEEDIVHRFSNHMKSIEKLTPICFNSIQGFRDHMNEAGQQLRKFSFAMLQLISGQGENTPDCINEEKVWCFKDNCKDCLKLTKALQEMAESLQSSSDIYDNYTNKIFTSSIDLLKEYLMANTSCSSLIEMHNITVNRSKQITNQELLKDTDIELIKSRCETVYNVTMAEINRIHDEKVQDFHTMNIDFIEQQIEFHEKMLEDLKKSRECLLDPKYSNYDSSPRELSKFKYSEMNNKKMDRPSSYSSMVGDVVDGVGSFLKNRARNSLLNPSVISDWMGFKPTSPQANSNPNLSHNS